MNVYTKRYALYFHTSHQIQLKNFPHKQSDLRRIFYWCRRVDISIRKRKAEEQTIMNMIITLLLEEDVVLLPEPGVCQVARIGFRLAGEEGILRDVHRYVLWW